VRFKHSFIKALKSILPHHGIGLKFAKNCCIRHAQDVVDNVDKAIGLGHISLDNGGINAASLNCDYGIRSLTTDIEVQEGVVVDSGYLSNLKTNGFY